MDCGSLNQRVAIQYPSRTTDEYGASTETWRLYGNRWASIRGMTGRELMSDKQAQSRASHKVIVRYDDGIKPNMRVIWGPRTLNIESVSDTTGEQAQMELICQEVVEQ